MSLPKNADLDKSNLTNRVSSEAAAQLRCARLTGVGRSAVAVIGVCGADAGQKISQCFTPATRRALLAGQIRYGLWHGRAPDRECSGQQLAAEAVVVVPISMHEWEIHVHGGSAAAARIVDDLQAFGATEVDPRHWLGRAGDPLLLREAQQVVTECLTARFAAVAMDQVRGALLHWAQRSLAAVTQQAAVTNGAERRIAAEAAEILGRATLGLRLADRFHVVLLGQPNVGKSSLINALVGYDRSITMDLPGTTRDVLHADTVIGGVPIRLTDTAGIRQTAEAIEQQGVQHAHTAAAEADLIVLVSDPQTAPMQFSTAQKTLVVLNKADLLGVGDTPLDSAFQTVATTGRGVADLIAAIANSLVSFPPAGSPIPVNDRQVELLRRVADIGHSDEAAQWLAELIG